MFNDQLNNLDRLEEPFIVHHPSQAATKVEAIYLL